MLHKTLVEPKKEKDPKANIFAEDDVGVWMFCDPKWSGHAVHPGRDSSGQGQHQTGTVRQSWTQGKRKLFTSAFSLHFSACQHRSVERQLTSSKLLPPSARQPVSSPNGPEAGNQSLSHQPMGLRQATRVHLINQWACSKDLEWGVVKTGWRKVTASYSLQK